MIDISTGKEMTRRDAIKGGLAAILTAGVAPAVCGSITRGLGYRNLAGRMAAIGGEKLTAKSYIQDGLVFMLDGIENAGFGEHDNSLRYWYDLVGGKIFALSDDANFTETSLLLPYCNAVYNGILFDGSLASGFTLEAIFNTNSISTYPAILCSRNDSFSFFYHGSQKEWQVKWNANISRVYNNHVYAGVYRFVFKTNFSNADLMINESISTGGYYPNVQMNSIWELGGNPDRYINGEIMSIRIYNKKNTQYEIEKNYAIDKVRFNLP